MEMGLPAYRKAMRLMVVLFTLAWLTQALLAEVGFGAEPDRPIQLAQNIGQQETTRAEPRIPADQRQGLNPDPQERSATQQPTSEKFVPGSPRFLSGVTLELRGEATVTSNDVRLRDVCRWSKADGAAFEPVADLVLTRMGTRVACRAFTVRELKGLLGDAGLNLGVIRFAGAINCTVTRADQNLDAHDTLEQWIDARSTGRSELAQTAVATTPEPTTRTAPIAEGRTGIGAQLRAQVDLPTPTERPTKLAVVKAVVDAPPAADAAPVCRTLRELLVADLSERLALPMESLEVHFNPADEKVLNLSEPKFRFNLERRRNGSLGEVSWGVLIVSDTGKQQTTIAGMARAWQEQLIVQKPMVIHQVIRDEDLISRRTLVERMPEDPAVTRDQAVGQMASRELRAGTLLTSRLVEAMPLVRAGQLVTINVQQGSVQVRTVARAMEPGTLGQTIRVRNEATRDVFEVICTGPQEARMSGEPKDGRTAPGVATLDRN